MGPVPRGAGRAEKQGFLIGRLPACKGDLVSDPCYRADLLPYWTVVQNQSNCIFRPFSLGSWLCNGRRPGAPPLPTRVLRSGSWEVLFLSRVRKRMGGPVRTWGSPWG